MDPGAPISFQREVGNRAQGRPTRRLGGSSPSPETGLPWATLAWGIPVALLLAFAGPIARYMGWFFASLVHEIGHCVVAFYFGHPAYPAIRLDGHAAAIHYDRNLLLVVVMWGGTAFAAWSLRHRHRPLALAAATLTLLYPLMAFTDIKSVLHLLGGHLGELAFAAVAFWRALSDVGFTASGAERALYAGIGWFLLAKNLVLTVGLMTSRAARHAYGGNGSFGLENDYIRVARDVLSVSLPTIAALMFVVALAVLPAAFFWVRHSSDARPSPEATLRRRQRPPPP